MNTIDIIRKVMKELGIDEWIIREEEVTSQESFYIRKDLDMNRAKNVKHYDVTLYRLFEEAGQAYKGSASLRLPSRISREEIITRLEKAWFAASFVKNPPYPMALPKERTVSPLRSRLAEEDMNPVMEELRESLYKNDIHREGGVNSAEIFLNRFTCRLVTSTGIDESWTRCQGDIELICDWKENGEDVEIYNMFSFADADGTMVEEECRNQIENCRLRSRARKATELKDINIILTGEAVRDMMSFYLTQSSAKGVYEEIARGKAGEIFQGNGAKGDLVSITLDPSLEGSPRSVPYDGDGTALERVEIFRDGKLLRYHGNQQYSHYLNVPATGVIANRVVAGGKSSVEEWKKEPHVEIRSFSDFQMDPMTGDFGGEIRLALWFNGKETLPLTGASLSACIFDVQKEFYLSKELVRKENYHGPAYLMYPRGQLS